MSVVTRAASYRNNIQMDWKDGETSADIVKNKLSTYVQEETLTFLMKHMWAAQMLYHHLFLARAHPGKGTVTEVSIPRAGHTDIESASLNRSGLNTMRYAMLIGGAEQKGDCITLCLVGSFSKLGQLGNKRCPWDLQKQDDGKLKFHDFNNATS